jgi:hypothetical protein
LLSLADFFALQAAFGFACGGLLLVVVPGVLAFP